MTPVAVTTDLLHHLVTGSHAEGVTAMAVASTIDHDGRILLIVQPGLDFIDDTWQLPIGPVLPGETLTDALLKAVTALGLSVQQVTGYLGHIDCHDTDGEITRLFNFAVTVIDPDGICRSARIGHRWADPDDLPDPQPPEQLWPARWSPPTRPRPEEPPFAAPLRAHARGLPTVEAATQLLINHTTWLHRRDFRDHFLHLDTSPGQTETADIDWPAAITALNTGELPCSGGEARVLRVAASLASGIPVNLRDALTGLDNRSADLVSQAVLHVSGHRPPSQTHRRIHDPLSSEKTCCSWCGS
jgi:8-oxo-dGTP diphosphatase